MPAASRAGDATPEAKEQTILQPRASYPLTGKVAKAAAQQIKRGASGAGRFLKRKPLLGVGLIAGAGLLAALVLRASDAAARRERHIQPPWPD